MKLIPSSMTSIRHRKQLTLVKLRILQCWKAETKLTRIFNVLTESETVVMEASFVGT